MRIILLGHKEIYSNLALSLVVKQLPGHDLRIFLADEATHHDPQPGTIERLEQYESRLCDNLPALAVSQAHRRSVILSFDELAEETGWPIGRLALPNSGEGLAVLKDLAPDLIVSLRYRKILHDEAIAIPRYGVLNLHSGLLPAYRGAMATFWALLNGDTEIGSTLHYIVDGTIDTGPVVGRARIPLAHERSYMASVLDLYPSGCAMVLDAIRAIENDRVAPSHKQQGKGRYFSWPTQDQVDGYFEQGYRFYGDHELDDFAARQAGGR
ncbi:MAG: formyl transferase [Proteobacteria bacterium]|nr:formyl transferase [Pseudomonadota bacterium]